MSLTSRQSSVISTGELRAPLYYRAEELEGFHIYIYALPMNLLVMLVHCIPPYTRALKFQVQH